MLCPQIGVLGPGQTRRTTRVWPGLKGRAMSKGWFEAPCPQCKSRIHVQLVGRSHCPHCATKLYVVDKWRWLRWLACFFPAILLNSRWYPTQCNIVLLLGWWVVVGLVFLLLLRLSVGLLPLGVDLLPQDGPIRLDL